MNSEVVTKIGDLDFEREERKLPQTAIIYNSNEASAAFYNRTDALEDRKRFVRNLGILLSQTRENVVSAHLTDNEIVVVEFIGGFIKEVNVNLDSYMAIVKDVVNNL